MIAFIIELVTIHCTDTDNGKNVSIEAIQKNHIARGFNGIGYHVIIQADGSLVQTRPLNETGAHVQGHNTRNIGIALAGRDRFTERQFYTLKEYLHTLTLVSNWKIWNLIAHSEFDTARKSGKSCPNIRMSDVVCYYLLNKIDPISKYLV